MSKHTPGPWTVHDEGEEGFAVVVDPPRPNEEPIVALSIDIRSNARLIAAAPRLLEALEKLCEACEASSAMLLFGAHESRKRADVQALVQFTKTNMLLHEYLDKAHAAISEAEGEERPDSQTSSSRPGD